MTPKSDRSVSGRLTRREFLARSSALVAGATAASVGRAMAGDGPPGALTGPQATVVRVRSDHVVVARQVHGVVLAEMLEKGLMLTTGAPNAVEAWRSLLQKDDVIGLKFNGSGAEALGTTVPMARALIESLTAAGFANDHIVPIEVPPAVYDEFQTARPMAGWDRDETAFDSGSDQLALVLRQVTAIVNVPFLKDHNIAGLTCCLKNLSHALVKHPARFHGNHCTPYISDIVALPQIRDKLRLHVVNALRLVYAGGPEAPETSTAGAGLLFVGTDPVDIDTIAIDEINYHRNSHDMRVIEPEDGWLGYLQRGAERGLGCANPHDIRVLKVRL
ncbi:MAG: DUF362 domain-containing protein [Planctomycetes bacterium]|nr:DUF362 domain-containing protein [Planctomycetota bacterium]